MTPLGTSYVDVALAADGAESNQVVRSASNVRLVVASLEAVNIRGGMEIAGVG